MNILAISGSLRSSSTNTYLLKAAAQLAPQHVTITLYDGLDDLPHFSPERDGDNPPVAVNKLRALLRDADAVMICTPEYAHGIPGVLKNMLDWVVSSGEFVYKPVSVISASSSDMGGSRAHASLSYTLGVMTATVVAGASLIVPFVRTKLDANGQVTDAETVNALRSAVSALVLASQQIEKTQSLQN